MSRGGHLRLWAMGTIAWLAFWVGGLPDYYRQYPPAFMGVFDTVLLVAIVPVLLRILRRVPRRRRLGIACWIAFYFTVPLAVYDAVYCGLFLGHGIAFLWRYWYVTVYYVIPWIVAPGAAALAGAGGEPRREQGSA